MPASRLSPLALVAALCGLAAPAAAQEHADEIRTAFASVAGWQVEAITVEGALRGCRASREGARGVLALTLDAGPGERWWLSVPNGKRSQGEDAGRIAIDGAGPETRFGFVPRRAWAELAPETFRALRLGDRIEVAVSGLTTRDWPLDGSFAATLAAEDCVARGGRPE